jgi:hypothetical protein
VITLELVLIFTILGIGLLVGIVAIRNALFVRAVKKKATEVWVYDSGDPARILGKAFDLDEHEAPRLFYVDRDVAWGGATANYRAVIGIRDDRFTSRHRLYYQNTDCTSTDLDGICIGRAGNEGDDNQGVGSVPIEGAGESPIERGGGVGYLYPLQGGPSYGIGRDLDEPVTGLPGTLFRATAISCDTTLVQSRWTSQNVGEACQLFSIPAEVLAAFCPSGRSNPLCESENCRCLGNEGQPTGSCSPECACPDGWYRATGLNGNNCCPIGSEFDQQAGLCRSAEGDLVQAEPVQTAGGVNVFSIFEPPFHVNLPPDTTGTFFHVQPGATEGENIPTNIPYEGSGPMDFSSPADGVEGAPPP